MRRWRRGVEDYYAGRGESPGRWRGAGVRALGLTAGGRVQRSGFLALMRGLSPVDGGVLRAVGARSTVAAFDLTFSAPKSVSVLFAIGDEEVSGLLLSAHERAVDEALGYLEREACFTRRGHDGVERVPGEGFVAASYRHRMSRAGDPQLHTHVVVANMTRAEARYTALDAPFVTNPTSWQRAGLCRSLKIRLGNPEQRCGFGERQDLGGVLAHGDPADYEAAVGEVPAYGIFDKSALALSGNRNGIFQATARIGG